MTDAVIGWTQWPDLAAPDGVHLFSPADGELTPALCEQLTFFVPRFLGGPSALEPITNMPNLTVLQFPYAGYATVLPYLHPGVTLCNARGVHDESTAELAVGMAIAGRRGFAEMAKRQGSGGWYPGQWPSLTDSKVAIIGYGSVGRTIHRMLRGFAVEVTGFSRHGRGGALTVDELSDLIGGFDIVILAVSLTPETTGMFDAKVLAKMRDGALLINVSRGVVVDSEALLVELNSGRLRAALDVTDPEPLPPDHPLWRAPGCLITPHVGADSTAFEPRLRAFIIDQLRRLVSGEPLRNVIAIPPGRWKTHQS